MAGKFQYCGHYILGSYYRALFNNSYDLLKRLGISDTALLYTTFDYGRWAIWQFDDIGKKDSKLEDRVHELSKLLPKEK
jgi:hypothetical protein